MVDIIATGILSTILFITNVLLWSVAYYGWFPIIYLSFIPNIFMLIAKPQKKNLKIDYTWARRFSIIFIFLTILMICTW
jgi:hypothetical protein